MTCEEVKENENWAFLFDESKIDYLALIRAELSKEEIKDRYFVNTYESINLDEADVANLIKITANTLSNYSALKLIK